MAETETGNTHQTPERASGLWSKFKKTLLALIVIVAFAYVAAAGYMYVNQRGFVFVPSGELETPAERGLEGVTVETVEMVDGTDVTVWSAEPSTSGAPTVLYFHGNSKNVSTRSSRFKQILDSGYGLYAPSYRGYAGSEGSPSERAFISDALEHYDRLAATGTAVIVHGESLGTGVATAVVEQRPEAGLLVLEAPYTALVDMAYAEYPWLPVGLLMKDQMPTRERIGNVKAPVLIIHGTADQVIPVEHGQRLFERAVDPKHLKIVEGVGHSDLWKNGLWSEVIKNWESAAYGTGSSG
ncbi:MAG: lysophospholipase [Roseibium sp.]|uniref:alpha/beta hydrolase n=1 Tax=Roseibium sp. TaxID=1936156 RepID=UPI0026100A0C|nr:alpha/beta hydrolase [Roseibium sp.]MCV0424632.1 lysophospholipase [Roseibium sp.]